MGEKCRWCFVSPHRIDGSRLKMEFCPMKGIDRKPYPRWQMKKRIDHRPSTVQCGRFSYRICVPDQQNREMSSAFRSNELGKDENNSKGKQGRAQSAEPSLGRRDSPSGELSSVRSQANHSHQVFPQFSGSSLHSSKDHSKQLSSTESWAHRQFFSRPSTRQEPRLSTPSWESQYVPHPQAEVGRPSIEWMCTVSPSQWPRESIRPNTGKLTGLTDSRYLQSLNAKIQDALEGKTSLSASKEDKEIRRKAEINEDATVVRGLATPQAGVREQLLEEILRQLQGDGPMEKLQERLTTMDRSSSGVVAIHDFRTALNDLGEKSVLQEKHYSFLLQQAGTHEDAEGNTVVHYRHFLELLRLARNRAMAALQKATEVKKKGLMRWMHNRSLRILKAWRLYAQSKRHPPTKHL